MWRQGAERLAATAHSALPGRGRHVPGQAPLVRQEGAMPPTPYSELNAVLRELATSVQVVLGETFIGAYLQGSFAAGGFDRHSDVDFIIATERELSDDQVRTLQTTHGRIYDIECEWAKHLEGSYFPKDVLRSCDHRGRQLWYLDHGSRSLTPSDHCNTAVVRWVVREHGLPLIGPSPASLVDAIPADLLRREILATIRDWGREILAEPERFENRFYQSFIVLSYCRMLHDLHTGRIESKRAGAEWAKTTLDPSWAGLIERSWGGRPNPSMSIRQPPDPDDSESTLEFVRHAVEVAGALRS